MTWWQQVALLLVLFIGVPMLLRAHADDLRKATRKEIDEALWERDERIEEKAFEDEARQNRLNEQLLDAEHSAYEKHQAAMRTDDESLKKETLLRWERLGLELDKRHLCPRWVV